METKFLLILFIFAYNMQVGKILSQDFNELMMTTTFKILGTNLNGDKVEGSCFLVAKPNKIDPSKPVGVLVTAKHVLRDMDSETAEIKVRYKLSDTLYEVYNYTTRIMKNNSELFYCHKDTSIDLAAMYSYIPSFLDIKAIDLSLLADDAYLDEIRIHPVDNVFCLGYPFGYSSNGYYFPILSNGVIASYPIYP
ncbi:MAG: hypothetical protein JW917_00205 [Ignavibacteria bacterium]|nr:hypothetical protein [Ignavibacteria bacterium]